MNLNKFYLICLLGSLVFIYNTSWAQENNSDIFSSKKEVYFQFTIQNTSELELLTRIISIDKVRGLIVNAYANQKEFTSFLSTGIKYTILPAPSTLQKLDMFDAKSKSNFTWDNYPSYETYEMMMDTLVKNHPSICRLDTLTTLASGRRLLALKITNNPDSSEVEPKLLYVGSVHGDEIGSYVLMLRLADSLLNQYGKNTELTNLINSVELWIIPLANPDGTYATGNNTVNGATRSNANGIDINRNFPDRYWGNNPDGNAHQPETIALMHFDSIHNFNMSATLHAGAVVVNYPWDATKLLHADNDWWINISKKYADTILAHAPTSYFTEFPTGYTNGAAWYVIYGGRQDYLNYVMHCREITLEISDIKTPTNSALLNLWKYQHASLLNYIKESTKGITGVILDSRTKEPVYASIFINSHDKENSDVYSSTKTGAFYRPIFPGTYSFTVTANGYKSKTFNGIVVKQDSTIKLNILLSKTSNEITFVTTSHEALQLLPVSENMYQVYNNNKQSIEVKIYSIEGQLIVSKTINSSETITIHQFNAGIYIVELKSSNTINTYKIFKR